MQYLLKLLLITLILALAACSPPKKENFDSSMTTIEQLTRWNEFAGIVNMIDPEYLEDNPVSDLDVERLKQFRTSSYTVTQKQMSADEKSYRQTVVLKMYSVHNPVERQIRWQQEWRFNKETNRWTMFSGLPDLSRQ
ncbi:MAG: hypothetical protein L3J22_07335 [Xanthomonadales bacterium]|nr:hypothetical protein [Xanthomonadales bacterium]